MGLVSPGRGLGEITATKHRIGIMEVKKHDGNFSAFCVPLTPLPAVAQGPSVKVSALSQTLSSSSAPMWFGAQQCLEQS